jgi:hypothetical protein
MQVARFTAHRGDRLCARDLLVLNRWRTAVTTAPDRSQIGPIDVAVIGFVGDAFNGEIAPAIFDLIESGTVRVLDLAFVRKTVDGTCEVIELVDSELEDAYAAVTDGQQDLLSDVDLLDVAADLEPATGAMVVVWENLWLSRLAGAIRDSGGVLISHDRVPHESVLAALDALAEEN